MSKPIGGNPSSKATDKSALIASWCAAAGDKRMIVKPDKPSALVDVAPAEQDEDDVSKFAKFAAQERKNIADLGLQVDESWIMKEINRRWIAKHGSAPPDQSSAVTDTTSKPKMVVAKAKVAKEEPKKEPSKEKVEMSDIELPEDFVESAGLVFVGKFRDKFMYRSKEEPKVEVKVEPKKKAPSKPALKKPNAPAVQSAISKRKSKAPVKALVKASSPVRASSSKAKPATKAKPVVTTKQDADMAQWFSIATGRIYEKSSKNEKARAWVKEGLELFNASFDTPTGDDADEFEAAELARQFMMVTDDEAENEEEDDEAEDADYVGGSADEDEEEEEDEEDNDED